MSGTTLGNIFLVYASICYIGYTIHTLVNMGDVSDDYYKGSITGMFKRFIWFIKAIFLLLTSPIWLPVIVIEPSVEQLNAWILKQD